MYLFKTGELICTDSNIIVGGNLYLPEAKHTHFSNCDIKAKAVHYLDAKSPENNIEAYAGIELFENNCQALGANALIYDDM